ncbi:MAG: hypothetical protein R3C59_16180 [Planctomycetaceae bacterium]
MQPRLIASYGDQGVTYRYSGTVNVALQWTPMLLEIKELIESIQGDFNYCLLNRYRSRSDSMGWHADDEPEMGYHRFTFAGGDSKISDQAQRDQRDSGISGRPRNTHHHGRYDAAVLAT